MEWVIHRIFRSISFVVAWVVPALFFVVPQAVHAAFAGGSGTSGSPYQIATCVQLQDMQSGLSNYYILNQNIDCSDTVNWNSGAGFVPVGTSATAFTGSLNGQGYVISDLFISRSTTNYVGLFGFANGSAVSIMNVGLQNVTITGQQYVGALVGYIGGGGVASISYVSGGSVTGTNYVGGMFGWRSTGTTTNAYARVTVTSSGSNAGGFMGAHLSSTAVSNVYATGNVTATDYVGGLVAQTSTTANVIDNAFSTGSVTATTGSPSARGGVIGRSYANVNNTKWHKHSGNPSSCAGTVVSGSTAGCTSGTDVTYFYNSANAPFTSWTANTWSFSGSDFPTLSVFSHDTTAPTITSVSSDKANGSYTIGEVIDIDVTFSEAVTSTGNVTVTLETGTTDRTCTFTVSNAATGTCNYTVQAGDTSSNLTVSSISGTIADQASNAMTDFAPATNLAANKALVIDTANPTASTLSPSDGATGVSVTANIALTFDAAVNRQTGNITIKKSSDDSIVETVDVTSAQVTGTGTAIITIDPSVTLESETGYYVQVATTAFDDIAGNSYAGIADTTTWNFTTADVVAPTVATFSPADGVPDVALASNLVITFDEAVDVETGNITIKKASDGSVAETIDVTSGQVTGTGMTTITVNPTNNLEYGTGYYVQIDATAFDDPSGNSYAGISDTATWNFTTVAAPVTASDDDTDSLEVSDVEYSVTETTLTVRWKTDNDADSQVRYGTDRDLKKKKTDDDNEKKHEMTIKDLDPDTLYYFRINSEDDNGSDDSSRIYSVTTKKKEATHSLASLSLLPASELPAYQDLSVTLDDTSVKEETAPRETAPTFDEQETPKKIREQSGKQYATEVFKKDDRQYIKEVKFQILDDNDQPLANVPVTLHSEPRTGVTNEEGIVTFSDVPTGEHRLIFAYADQEVEKNVEIQDLKQENGPVKAEVIVINAGRDPIPAWALGLICFLAVALAATSYLLYRKIRR